MTTGTELIRQALRPRSLSLPRIAHTAAIPVEKLYAFVAGAPLDGAVLQKIALDVFQGHATLDIARDALVSTTPAAKPLAAAHPPTFAEMVASGSLKLPPPPKPAPPAKPAAKNALRAWRPKPGWG